MALLIGDEGGGLWSTCSDASLFLQLVNTRYENSAMILVLSGDLAE